METDKKEFGIYIHVPFCKKKCYYCDFISYYNKNDLIDRYIQSIILEIQNWKKNINTEKYIVKTIYIGGGTPSYIDSKHILQILENLKEFIDENIEITMEINPGTVTKPKLEAYKNAGINRISIGLQETHDELLKLIGRIHNYNEFLESYKMAKEVGFENINIDLMIGLPMQTIQDIKESLERILELDPAHISVYSLILEPGTVLEKRIEQGELILPDEEKERNMYWYVKNILELNGFKHYEISNFAKAQKESRHNVSCWEQNEYRGFGIAAHSYMDGIRFSNTTNLEEYIENIENNKFNSNIRVHERQDEETAKKEYMMLGLRKLEGISIMKFKNKFKGNPLFIFKEELNELSNNKLLEIDGDTIKLTSKGLDLANQVWEKFV